MSGQVKVGMRRFVYVTIGGAATGLAVLGVWLPGLPTTPFLLVAVWAFSKSSPELAEKIRNHRLAGPFIRDWQDAGVIPVKAKALSLVMMAAIVGYLHFGAHAPAWITVLVAVVLAATASFIMTRPSRRPD